MQAAWDALGNVTAGIPKESFPSYLKVVRDAVQSARDKERRKRKLRPHEVRRAGGHCHCHCTV